MSKIFHSNYLSADDSYFLRLKFKGFSVLFCLIISYLLYSNKTPISYFRCFSREVICENLIIVSHNSIPWSPFIPSFFPLRLGAEWSSLRPLPVAFSRGCNRGLRGLTTFCSLWLFGYFDIAFILELF